MDHGKFFVNIQRISMNNNHDEKNSFQDIYKSLYKYMQASNRGFFFSGVDSSRLLIPLLNNIAPVLYKIQSDEFDPTLKSSAISNFTFEQVIFFKSCPVCKIFFSFLTMCISETKNLMLLFVSYATKIIFKLVEFWKN